MEELPVFLIWCHTGVSQSRRQARFCREKCYLTLEKKTRGAGRKPGLHTYLLSVQFLPGTSREILLGDRLPEGQDRWVKFPARQGDIFCLPLLNGNIITYQETNSNQCPFFFFCFFAVYPIKIDSHSVLTVPQLRSMLLLLLLQLRAR